MSRLIWRRLGERVAARRLPFHDNKYEPTSTARDQSLGQADRVVRRLNDGRAYEIVKVFYEREELERRLSQLGWDVRVTETPHHFLFGEGGVA